jgi:hypothetical protein
MSTMHESQAGRGLIERPDTPAQVYAAVVGLFLTALGVLALGVLGLFSMARLDTARSYSLLSGVIFAVVAVWGFIDGNDVAEIIAADTTNNVMHAILAGLGLVAGMLPGEAQRPAEPVTRGERTGRFDSSKSERPIDRPTTGRR